MQIRDFSAEIVSTDQVKGELVATASTFNSVDEEGDIILPGAFSKTLSEHKASHFKFLYQHDPFYPLGIIRSLTQTKDGLEMRAKFAMNSAFVRDKFELARMGAFGGVSIGFSIPAGKSRIRPDGVREISEVKLMEVSLVTFPANTEAKIQDVKGADRLMQDFKTSFGLSAAGANSAAEGLKALHKCVAAPEPQDLLLHSLKILKSNLI
ncbi:MAG: HK97 family phage prohead protease [Alphaproteobacteria bacterium]|nr:HK97 family phage prohead protease [Alphaproteobacteria bacterium]